MTLGTTLDKLPRWSKWATSFVALCGAMYAMYAWGGETIDKAIVTEKELGAVLTGISIQHNQERLLQLQRDILAERFANEAEKNLVIKEFEKIQRELNCQQNPEKCEKE